MLSKWFWIELEEEALYWITGKKGWLVRDSLQERCWHLKELVWRQYRRIFRCPVGVHYIKWNSGDPKCILCNKRHREIFPEDPNVRIARSLLNLIGKNETKQ